MTNVATLHLEELKKELDEYKELSGSRLQELDKLNEEKAHAVNEIDKLKMDVSAEIKGVSHSFPSKTQYY
jgi:E3 ubiquitin-protein ligase BRE1